MAAAPGDPGPADNDDLAELEVLTDDILCDCLNTRYQQDKIYTYVGDILIAVNPFKMLGFYTNEMSARYCNVASKADHPPHLFAIADAAYSKMKRGGRSQVCVISGESGAGKTESAKQFVRQIMDVSARGAMGGGVGPGEGATEHVRAKHPVETKIINQNPILEAFGNAKTVMNDNSSRFGKFIDLKFGQQGTVTGADMSHYLLEKARIVKQGPGERNYHIFAMLFTGLSQDARNMYGLRDIAEFRYMPEENGEEAELQEMWGELVVALAACGFTDKEQDEMFSVLAGVLHLGNLDFVDGDDGDAAVVQNDECADAISRILMVDERRLKAALMTSILNMRGESITKKNNVEKCTAARNATAKALYDKLFQWLVFKINLTLRPKDGDSGYGSTSIGILDIFGFENFKQNGFDQMCINLANEQLHFFFNQHIFAEELGSYADEGLDLAADTMFHDNKLVLDIFFRRNPPGILGLLDEESRFPKATASSLLNKFNKNLANDQLFNEVKGNYAFGVQHYAGDIVYHTEGFLEKNTDPLPDLVPPACEASHSSLLKLLFAPNWEAIAAGGGQPAAEDRGKSFFGKMFQTKKRANRSQKVAKSRRRGSKTDVEGVAGPGNRGPSMSKQRRGDKKEPQTVSASFRASLALLMLRMGACDPHFIRCIKPNQRKLPRAWEQKMVLRQLTYTGMLQTVKMRREGYPHRVKFVEFFNAYHGIIFEFSTHLKGTPTTCTELLEALEKKVEEQRAECGDMLLTSKLCHWKVAKTMVFLKYWQLDLLNSMAHPFEVAALRVQTCYRRFIAQKKFKPMKEKYADEQAMAATLIGDIRNGMDRMFGFQQTLVEEEERRGPIDLGISKPVPVKEVKKAEKAMRAGKAVDQKKFEKDLNKIKKGVVRWWVKIERQKGFHVDEEGNVYPWFHGLISRTEAEDYLFDQPNGAFLIRVSERVNGYALSFRHGNRIRHYKLGFSSGGGYTIVGNAEEFGSLVELVDYFKHHPVTAGDDDILTEAVQFEHDLGLGISHSDDIQGKSPPMRQQRRMSAEEREAKSKTIFHHVGTESKGEPMPYEQFLQSVDPKPRWLRGKISRGDAEEELEDRGMVDGRFLVREKLRSHERVVLALSVSFRKKFYHHLLMRHAVGQWHLDEKPIDYNDSLEEVIHYLQRKKSPRLATVLEAEVPEAPAGVVDTSLHDGGGAVAAAAAVPPKRSNLVPSVGSTVDDVVAWLASLGLAKYAGGFYKAKFDGKKLHKATEKQLRKIVKSEDDYILMVRALR
mmetsp:Transcript_35727/g.93386  ORF Transcript_35727/g.93386 Transcript_35727/m.93386 type:complete len:1264 (-) Transcript_35727:548-4339(-)|eukprot:CAMPEP_0182915422 /NCGR_PEP_ID=MMETSP0105_2-20130417/319_1 /TAXON_ID=81532 ORGANISM="Acanthoeca-like sp., Strain 10tr" /NCGR_SAMPLE_ID=MMETSP0105_2 /ASSEMBLY_ACC=CAM_ASM_000205 /LENGTH=1263 /DNA_ID=CAMNT_0025052289 /DNA_START=63 /DNA_END=3854 /DNA_ORIENTATION=-